jgi:hypothetical protein
MSNQNFSVTIPGNPQELGGLSQRVLDKHVLDGAGSVLNPLDMADMQAKTTLAKIRDAAGAQLERDKETAFQMRDLALGIGLTNTVDYFVKSSRDVLLGINQGKEQNLGAHGFNVNMSTGYVSVEIPSDAPGLMALADLIIAKHVLDGPASPLAGLDMVMFSSKNSTAKAQHNLGRQLNRDKEKANGERDHALGIAEGQTTKTEGTVKFYVTSARNVLLGHNRGKEYNLGDWGYDVQFSSGAGAPTGTFTATPSSILAGGTSTLEWNISGSTSVSIDNSIGAVAATGSQIVSPAATTTYRLTATASGGATLTIFITITVT